MLPTGDVVQIGKGAVWGPDHFDTPCVVDFCSAACLMMRPKGLLKVADPGFEWSPPTTRMSISASNSGRSVQGDGQSVPWVIHIESKTTSDRLLQLQDISEINRCPVCRQVGSLVGGSPNPPMGEP